MSHKPDRLVVEGVRRCLSGYATKDHGCWELVLKLFEAELGRTKARHPLSDLSFYARDLHLFGKQAMCVFPYGCPNLCQDECLVAALVSASQAGDTDVAAAIAQFLVQDVGLASTIHSANALAGALMEIDLQLSPVSLEELQLAECPLKKLIQKH
ncbi:hypothetical protein E1178_07595 [Roseibium hamelinense]|nr:hypothetical protein [Roseibium hamelinense]MTI43471.1 hypothetical protein [Roseibium hamelinense]